MKSKITIYTRLQDMRPHQEMQLMDWRVLRVPGGWIYTNYSKESKHSSVFVSEIRLNLDGEPYV